MRKHCCVVVAVLCIGLAHPVFVVEGGPVSVSTEQSLHGKTLGQLYAAGGDAGEQGRDPKETIVARVNGSDITLQSVINMMNRLRNETMQGGGIPPDRETLRREAVDRVILEELAYRKAIAEGMKVPQEELDKVLENLRARMGGDEALMKALQGQKQSLTELRADIEKSIILQRIFAKEVFDKVVVSEEELKRAYENEKDKFVRPEHMVATTVVFFLDPDSAASLEVANNTLQKILDDKERNPWKLVFDGTFVVYDAEIKKEKQGELYAAAKKMKVGELSGVVKTGDSLLIMKLNEDTPERQLTFGEVKGFLEAKLRTEAGEKKLREWEKELRKGAKIEIRETEEGK